MGGDRFPAGPPKCVYFLRNSFSLRFSEKVSKQTMFRTAWYIYFIKTFFSHVNTKRFFLSSDPLHQPWLPTSFLCSTVFYCILYGIVLLRTLDRSDVNRCVQRRALLESFVCQTTCRWSDFILSINKKVKNYWTWIKLETSDSSLPH